MQFLETAIQGVIRIRPQVYTDQRGSFREQFRNDRFKQEGLCHDFVQDNVSISTRGVIRGMHYQIIQPQIKLVTVLKGSVVDVAVDLRKHSPTYGKYVSLILSEQNMEMLYIPEGFAHGFQSLEDGTIFSYKCSDYYCPEGERSIVWSDPDINIHWPIQPPVLSHKDVQNPRLNTLTEQDLPV